MIWPEYKCRRRTRMNPAIRPLFVESLEPRYLLSSSSSPVPALAGTASLTYPATDALPQSPAIISRWLLTEELGTRHDLVGPNDLLDSNSVGNGVGYANPATGIDFQRAADFERDNHTFLGISDAAQIGLDITGSFTISTLFKPEGLVPGLGHTLVSKFLPSQNNIAYRFGLTGEHTVALTVSSNGTRESVVEVKSAQSLIPDTWYHLVGVFDPGRSLRVYINGDQDGLNTVSIPSDLSDKGAAFILGATEEGREGHADGLMNDAIIWNSSLTDAEVRSLYDSYGLNISPPAAVEVADVLVSGQSWDANVDKLSLLSRLEPNPPLPWLNADRIDVVFTQNVEVSQRSLTLAGVNIEQYVPDTFTYDADSFTASWMFSTPFATDKLLLTLAGEQGDLHRIDDQLGPGGHLLNGGNDWAMYFDLLPGDVTGDGRTDITDLVNVASRIPAQVGTPGYDPNYDINADGVLDIGDLVNVATRVISSLPPGQPMPPLPPVISTGLLGTISPGETYTISGQNFETDGPSCIPVDLNLAQGNTVKYLASACPAPPDGSFGIDVAIPTTLPGGSSLQAARYGAVLTSTPVTVLHSESTITDLFTQAFGRAPNATNLLYWQSRTDKMGPPLLGAMEFARQQYLAAQLKMELLAFTETGQTIAAPAGVAEDDKLLARFTNATPGEEASIHLVYQGTIVKSATELVNADGTVDIAIWVPNPLLPEVFAGPVEGLIDVTMVHGDRAQTQTLQLREGPRLLLKSAEVTEGQYMYFAVRGVTAEEDVHVTLRYDWGSGSREQTWTIGRTDGSNHLDDSHSKLMTPPWIRGEAQADGIEIDIDVADDHRGYRATLLKGPSRDDIIAELIRTSGTSSIEAELAVLLTEEERIVADSLLGDDWEGNAHAISDKLDEIIVQGGGFDGSLTDGVTQLAITTLVNGIEATISQLEVFRNLIADFFKVEQLDIQNDVEGRQPRVDVRYITPQPDYTRYCPNSSCFDHLGIDYHKNAAGIPGIPVLSPVTGNIEFIGPAAGYGTMLLAIEVSLSQETTFASEYSDDFGNIVPVSTNKLLVSIGHLRPSQTPGGATEEDFSELGLEVGDSVTAGVTVIGYIEKYDYNGKFVPHVHISAVDANNRPNKPYRGRYPTGTKPEYLKQHIDLEHDWNKLP